MVDRRHRAPFRFVPTRRSEVESINYARLLDAETGMQIIGEQ